MINITFGNITRAEAVSVDASHSSVRLYTLGQNGNQMVTLLLPAGTADAIAACINVAVASGQQATALRTMGLNPSSISREVAL